MIEERQDADTSATTALDRPTTMRATLERSPLRRRSTPLRPRPGTPPRLGQPRMASNASRSTSRRSIRPTFPTSLESDEASKERGSTPLVATSLRPTTAPAITLAAEAGTTPSTSNSSRVQDSKSSFRSWPCRERRRLRASWRAALFETSRTRWPSACALIQSGSAVG